MDFPNNFVQAFDHAMLYEVGSFWNPNDPDVIVGNYSTREQRRKVGYVNIPADRGGETKYGVAQNANPNIVVRDLDLCGAMEVYFNDYWLKGVCDRLPYPLSLMHFDGCVNHGTTRAARFLQRAAGVVDDGKIGRMTLAAVNKTDQLVLLRSISDQRFHFYNNIVKNNPSQSIFLKGWLRRITEVTDYSLASLS
jgi:lysozyme family protein